MDLTTARVVYLSIAFINDHNNLNNNACRYASNNL